MTSVCLKYSITFRHLCTLHRYLLHRYFISSFLICSVIDMPYRRRFGNRRRLGLYGGAAALGGLRSAYRLGGAAVSRLYNKVKSKFYRKTKPARKRFRRYPNTFLRSIGMTNNKFAVHIHRGTYIVDGTSTGSGIEDIATFSLNNLLNPTSSSFSVVWTVPGTGVNHMASLYRRYTVLGTKLEVFIVPERINNFSQSTNGTSTYTYLNNPPLKFGIHNTEGSIGGDGITKWDEFITLGEPVKTLVPAYETNQKGIRLVHKWSLRRHVKNWSDDTYSAASSGAPTTVVKDIVWNQVADLTTATPQTKWAISWKLTQFTRWMDFIGGEADMKQEIGS